MTATFKSLILALFLFCAILLGGASNGGFLANALLQLSAVLLLGISLWSPSTFSLDRARQSLKLLLLAGLGLVLLQFVPLPESLWTLSAGRSLLVEEGAVIGLDYAPRLWALLPYEAMKSAIWALPAFAIGVTLLRWPDWQPQHLAWSIVAGMALSVILGALQLAQGYNSPFYLYAITNRETTVGFFANGNHLATLLLVSLPITAALADHYRQHSDTAVSRTLLLIAGGLVLLVMFGLVANGSLAGFGLAGPVLVASMLILVSSSRLRLLIATLSLLVMAAMAGWFFTRGPNNLLGIEEVGGGGRAMIWEGTWRAITDFWPLGSGLGSFAEVFARYEPREAAGNAYVNHAHNDYLELVLEFGLIIIPVLLGFLFWWGQRVVRIWLAGGGNRWAEAGTVASAAILTHEIVDYPLRTAAISVVFMACLVLMALPLSDAVKQIPKGDTGDKPEPNHDQWDRRARQSFNPYQSLLR